MSLLGPGAFLRLHGLRNLGRHLRGMPADCPLPLLLQILLDFLRPKTYDSSPRHQGRSNYTWSIGTPFRLTRFTLVFLPSPQASSVVRTDIGRGHTRPIVTLSSGVTQRKRACGNPS